MIHSNCSNGGQHCCECRIGIISTSQKQLLTALLSRQKNNASLMQIIWTINCEQVFIEANMN